VSRPAADEVHPCILGEQAGAVQRLLKLAGEILCVAAIRQR
jgi:hypothetical protein